MGRFVEEGKLVKKENGRYAIGGSNGLEFTSGEPVEVLFKDQWILTRVEWGVRNDYYFADFPNVLMEGSIVRRP